MHLTRDCRLSHTEGMLAARVGNGGHLATRAHMQQLQAILHIEFNDVASAVLGGADFSPRLFASLRALKQHVASLSIRN